MRATIFGPENHMRHLWLACLLIGLCVSASCKSSESSPQAGDPITGIWVGDFGPAFYDRNTISLDLHWDGKELTGQIAPGVQGARMYRDFPAFPIENASFDLGSGAVKFQATYKPKGRRYIIEGAIKNNVFSGTWNRPEENRSGDFKLKRK
jgi:hypothetical protein